MNKNVSNYLDIVRVVASFAVLFQHLSMFNHDVFPFFQNYGHQAVIAFFVLSGYVIAFVASERENTYSLFLRHRLSRIYSVMVVAWLLTILLDSVGPYINSSTYTDHVASDYLLVRIFSHLLFLQESWFVSIQFFGNEPLWSLAYEFSYYMLFGVLFSYQGKHKLLLGIMISLIMGPVIFIYGFIWMAGVFLYKSHKKAYKPNSIVSTVLVILSIAMLILYPVWEKFLEFNHFSYGKLNFTTILKDFVFAFFICINLYYYKYSSLSFYFIKPVISFFAGISFSLYVFHFPLIYFIGAISAKYSTLNDTNLFILMTILIVYIVYLLSFISEKKKKLYFNGFSKLFDLLESKLTSR